MGAGFNGFTFKEMLDGVETGELAGTACNGLTLTREEGRVTHPNMPPTPTKCFYQVLLGPAGLTTDY